MSRSDRLSRRELLAGALALIPARAAFAQEFPARPIKIVVPYPAGGPVDALARLLAQEMQTARGWTVVVENKAGASGAVATREVARAEPDGHTLVLGTNQTHATNAFLLRETGYDVVRDFMPVAGLADLQHALVVPKIAKAETVADFVAAAKANPGRLNYGSSGTGSASHLAMELFKARAGIEAQHVPFRGAAPLATELLAGRIDAAFVTLPAVLTLIEAREIRALAIASPRRAPQLPDLPTLQEQGIKGAEADAWIALFAPARTPAATLATLTATASAAMGTALLSERAKAQGLIVNVRAGPAFRGFQQAEVDKWADVARMAKVTPK